MAGRPTVIERAYELADSGTCRSVSEIVKKLDAEGYPGASGQLYGPVLKGELRRRCQAAAGKDGA